MTGNHWFLFSDVYDVMYNELEGVGSQHYSDWLNLSNDVFEAGSFEVAKNMIHEYESNNQVIVRMINWLKSKYQ